MMLSPRLKFWEMYFKIAILEAPLRSLISVIAATTMLMYGGWVDGALALATLVGLSAFGVFGAFLAFGDLAGTAAGVASTARDATAVSDMMMMIYTWKVMVDGVSPPSI
ncbi:hypothetical protein GCK72_025367 [Caenorhabditis remanei]|uniref:Uncharacterized protein n=1 Tax=Caenorhabditis remanei TaxID=31234 RepID=A0A6A5G1R5_CAERE|nr:hypothetical protein GCK72_025367 [Caenorhabditis remanei]KAF1748900.1 hypothetical protein GCK72_025367 [Caenorhabditis remanei]